MTTLLLDDSPDVLERAVDLASVEGLEGLSIAGLAGELGADAAGFADEFESDQQLQLAVWKTAIDLFLARVVMPAMDAPEGRPRLEALCESYVTYIAADLLPGGCFMATVSAEFDNRPGAVRDAVVAEIRRWMDALAFMAEAAGAEDPHQVAYEVQSIVQGANQNYQLFDDPAIFDRARKALSQTLREALPPAPE